MERATPQETQRQFILFFFIWSLVTGVVLLIMSLTERLRHTHRNRGAGAVWAGWLSTVVILLFSAIAWLELGPAMLTAGVVLVSVPLAVVNYFWARATVRLSIRPLLLSLAAGQALASSSFVLFKHAPAPVQLLCLTCCIAAFCIVAIQTTALEPRPVPPCPSAAPKDLGSRHAGVPYPLILTGIAASTLGVGLLWGSSQVIRSYELWVSGAMAVCLAALVLLMIKGRAVRADLILRAVFIVLGVAILFAVLVPSMNRLFIGLVWAGYTVLSLAVFSTGHLNGSEPDESTDIFRLGLSLACFSAFMGLGLIAGQLVSVHWPSVETPSLVAVVLLLLSAALVGRFPHNAAENTSVAPVPHAATANNQIAEAIRARCHVLAQEYGLSSTEEDTLFFLARGHTIRRISEERCVSENTVKTQISSLYRKVGAHSRLDIATLLEAADATSPATRG